MNSRIVSLCLAVSCPATAAAQETMPPGGQVASASAASQLRGAPVILPRDTPIHLMVLNEVTTKTHPAGHRFVLRVDQPVLLGARPVIPVGTRAWGEVTSADSSGNVGRPGALSARLLYVELDGRQLPITGETTSRGKGGGAETVMGVLALGPFGLFAKGNNAKIKAGERITAFTTGDVDLSALATSMPAGQAAP